ncbi:MAG: MotA/TolQ/ExbB proton channel family protein [Ignavibacteriales bacterium]|nr:MAG: MotA/TolQ/ExbB proton channel family protein [Ignavibacteriaceae bacterium]MBW7872040.1 MotA/TolQ/ExbB proton channel family protein [Ignavibacteria bacterium]MCZ2143675.1 MotA/TolQ/ExbB proton channel family protein [Ignavibacteriales bacterium]OQY75811.1 MAG: biopolymer transporter [Ignavibacteriales bacterium UTCHB3]MBV6446063.1 Protein TolQ [Ignavibacteriaceae bacterium]
MNLMEMFLKGGLIMWPILLLSVIGLAVIIEKLLSLRKAKVNVPKFILTVETLLRKNDVAGTIQVLKGEKSPIAVIIKKALRKHKYGYQRVREAIEDSGNQEVGKLERGMWVLATVAGAAPLLGFLGTVTGMVTAFMTVEHLQGNATPADLAAGIYEALITTVFGLVVGIPALIAYNYLLSQINKVVLDMEAISTDVIDTLEDVSHGNKTVTSSEFDVDM